MASGTPDGNDGEALRRADRISINTIIVRGKLSRIKDVTDRTRGIVFEMDNEALPKAQLPVYLGKMGGLIKNLQELFAPDDFPAHAPACWLDLRLAAEAARNRLEEELTRLESLDGCSDDGVCGHALRSAATCLQPAVDNLRSKLHNL